MKILVCISHVPDTTSKINFTDNNSRFDPQGVQFIIGPYDDYALARAVELKESSGAAITVLNVGLVDTEPTIRKALAIGADEAVRVNAEPTDSFFVAVRVNAEPTDSFFVATQIAEYARAKSYDLILMGRESIDYNGGVVHGIVGELLGIPSVSPVMKLDIEGNTAKLAREIEGGKEYLELPLPFVAGCQEPIAEWKIPNMRGIMSARTKPLNVIEPVAVDSGIKPQQFELPPPKGTVKMIAPENVAELVSLLKNEAKVL